MCKVLTFALAPPVTLLVALAVLAMAATLAASPWICRRVFVRSSGYVASSATEAATTETTYVQANESA